MSGTDELAKVAQALLKPHAPALERYRPLETDGDSARVFIAARHDVATEVLSDEVRFSLRHYDLLLAQVAGPVRYLVGEDDALRKLRISQLHAAQAHVDKVRKAPPSPDPANLAPSYRAWIAGIAREEADAILHVLERRGRTGESVNFAREYAFLLAYRMARRIIGVAAPAEPTAFVRLLIAVRNLLRPGPWVRLKGGMGAATTMLTLLQPLFGHVFGTVTTSPGWLQAISRSTTRDALAAFDLAWDLPGMARADSLLAGLRAAQSDFEGNADYRTQGRSVLFELTGALVLIVGKSLAEIAAFATSPRGHAAGIGWPELVARLADDTPSPADHDATINEMLRLVGGSRLVRTVRSDCTWRGVDLREGDRVLVMVEAASRDPAAFPDPGTFAPDPARPYITSGPLQGPHVCYGRVIAWTIMREAIVATAGRIVPAKDAKLAVFAALPDDLPFAIQARPNAPAAKPRHRRRGRRNTVVTPPGTIAMRNLKSFFKGPGQ
ncbi:hypothetical protein GGQ88_000880 [Novosphingobium hassiacum]|uniref:Cytochrome P450 n=1 Tax=Novosphingobium hassiacum TaxID=173676 RepID=A0A7W6EV64_9SPHN|nr:cytochrome P450 [Novosphingobium hassiacum]MBB3859640.1 hypothetical protein [Novosphingobium hassiacum]